MISYKLLCPQSWLTSKFSFEKSRNLTQFLFLAVVSVEGRSVHLSNLVQEAQQRVSDLSAQVMSESLGTDSSEKEKQLKAWEWRYRLYKRMKSSFEHSSKSHGEKCLDEWNV